MSEQYTAYNPTASVVGPPSVASSEFPVDIQVKIDPLAGLIEGRIVHYVLSNMQHRPAIVVRNWSNPTIPGSDGMVNLIVFSDGSNDKGAIGGNVTDQGIFWATSVHYDPTALTNHTWHWIERA